MTADRGHATALQGWPPQCHGSDRRPLFNRTQARRLCVRGQHATPPTPHADDVTSKKTPRRATRPKAAAPFDADLQRLAEILGTLHYLRGICGTNEGAKWRNEMQALVDAETPSGERRARMIAGFNRGYNGFQQTYRTCTPAASVAIRRYIEEGSKISRDLTARYAN